MSRRRPPDPAPPEKPRPRGSHEAERANGQDKAALRAHLLKIRPARPNLRHGWSLPVDPDTIARYRGRLVASAPHLAQARYAVPVDLLCRALIRLDRVDEWYASAPQAWYLKSFRSGRAVMQAVEKQYVALLERALRACAELGLTPASARALGLDVAAPDEVDLAAALAQRSRDGGGA